MSKDAANRALREARYNARNAKATATAPPARSVARPKPETPTTTPAPVVPAASTNAPATDALCGHRSMNGRSCTREAGHEAKSHRYS